MVQGINYVKNKLYVKINYVKINYVKINYVKINYVKINYVKINYVNINYVKGHVHKIVVIFWCDEITQNYPKIVFLSLVDQFSIKYLKN